MHLLCTAEYIQVVLEIFKYSMTLGEGSLLGLQLESHFQQTETFPSGERWRLPKHKEVTRLQALVPAAPEGM